MSPVIRGDLCRCAPDPESERREAKEHAHQDVCCGRGGGRVDRHDVGLRHQAELPPLSLGFVSLIGVAVIAPVASYVAPYGAHLAHRLPRRVLEIAFGNWQQADITRFEDDYARPAQGE